MKKYLLPILLSALSLQVKAQEQFILKGKIEFERITNLHKQLESEEDETWRNMIRKSVPQFKTNYFNLYFDHNKTVYKPGREVVTTQKVPDWIDGPGNDNYVFTDLEQQNFSSQKTVFDDIFNIQDSIRKMDWKITNDTRTIAGFECRRATAVIMDSVFVVAFYTNQIVPSGGPESFAGLPGMILGLAIPRMHTTWYATKLETIEVSPAILIPPKKGKKTNIGNLRLQLKTSMKNWGKWGDKNIWQIMI